MIARHVSLVLFAVMLLLQASPCPAPARAQAKTRKAGLYAVFDTSMGQFTCELYAKPAPLAVDNFVGLAEGTKEWLSPTGDFLRGKPFYNGLAFHRVIKGFMIQAGEILGKGGFNPVIAFKDEISPSLRFDRPGVLAMANNGPKTNGSQFFITVAATAHLTGKHTIFGRVIEGYEVVEKISNVPVGPARRPLQDVVIRQIRIERVK